VRVSTFYDDTTVGGTIEKGPSDTGLCVINCEGMRIVRHVSKLDGVDTEARLLIEGWARDAK
jgi:hypothetical protein